MAETEQAMINDTLELTLVDCFERGKAPYQSPAMPDEYTSVEMADLGHNVDTSLAYLLRYSNWLAAELGIYVGVVRDGDVHQLISEGRTVWSTIRPTQHLYDWVRDQKRKNNMNNMGNHTNLDPYCPYGNPGGIDRYTILMHPPGARDETRGAAYSNANPNVRSIEISYTINDSTDQRHAILQDFAEGINLPELGLYYDEEFELDQVGPVGGHPDNGGLVYHDIEVLVKSWEFDDRWPDSVIELFAEAYLEDTDAVIDGRTVRLEEVQS